MAALGWIRRGRTYLLSQPVGLCDGFLSQPIGLCGGFLHNRFDCHAAVGFIDVFEALCGASLGPCLATDGRSSNPFLV